MLIEIFKNWKKLNDIIILICLESRKMEEIEKYQYIIAILTVKQTDLSNVVFHLSIKSRRIWKKKRKLPMTF